MNTLCITNDLTGRYMTISMEHGDDKFHVLKNISLPVRLEEEIPRHTYVHKLYNTPVFHMCIKYTVFKF